MSDLLEEESVMAPQVSPKDIPRGGDNFDSEDDEPVAPVIMENISSSDDDDEDNMEGEEEVEEVNGYVQLAQDDSEGQQPADQYLSNTEEEGSEVDCTPVTDGSESNSSSSGIRSAEPEMKQEQVDLIRQVMSGITLPTSAIPEWAKVVPEENWKATLVSSITNRTPSPPDSGTKN